MVADTELYDLLNCAPDASASELKAAYRKASLANHPDKNPGNEEAASARFQEIGAAYEILSDPDQRAAYDRYGKEQPGMGGMSGGPDMDDIFAEMFGGGRGGGRGKPPPRRRPKKGQDSRIQYAVTLQDLYNGRTAHFNLKRDRFCGACSGSGGRPGAKPQPCVKCGGEGRVRQLRDMGGGMVAQSFGTCNACDGEGEKVREKERCKKCKGAKVRQEATKLDIVIERGMHDGQCIVCKGENDQEPGVPEAGDLIFQLSLQDDPSFSLNGLDLLCTCRLTLSEALLGFDRTVLTHLDGRHIRVERRAGTVTRPGDVQRVRGEGMMTQGDRGERGDLYIRWEIDFPPDNFLSDVDSLKLAHLLPAKRPSPPADETTTVETVAPETAPIEEFGRNALPSQEHEWEDDDMSAGGGGGGGPQCAHQ